MENRSFRRLVKQLITSWIGRQNCHCREELTQLNGKLHQVGELIDILAREMSRQGKRLKGIGQAIGYVEPKSNEEG
jgi:hypothetical protein